jgi:hypothetical protein
MSSAAARERALSANALEAVVAALPIALAERRAASGFKELLRVVVNALWLLLSNATPETGERVRACGALHALLPAVRQLEHRAPAELLDGVYNCVCMMTSCCYIRESLVFNDVSAADSAAAAGRRLQHWLLTQARASCSSAFWGRWFACSN